MSQSSNNTQNSSQQSFNQSGGGYYINPREYYATTQPSPGNYPAPVLTLPNLTPQQSAYVANLNHVEQIVPNKERHALGALQFEPVGIKFSGQNPREKVFILLRAHIITNLGWVFRAAISALLPFVITGILTAIGFNINQLPLLSGSFTANQVTEIVVVIVLIYYSLLLTTTFRNFVNWYYNIYLITNERAIDINFDALVSYKILEARLDDIESVKEKSIGLLPSIFGYGDIYIQTAANLTNFDFISVPEPSRVRDIISDLSSFAKRIFGNKSLYRDHS